MKERLHFIDIAKGLLIISVVWFHMWTILRGSCGLSHPMFDTLYSVHKLYCCFFMPAFFVITGYCTNFERPFKNFLLANVKAILVPMVFLNLIPCLLSFNMAALRYLISVDNWLWGLSFWFLPVLFLSKLFYWPIGFYIKGRLFGSILVLLMLIIAIALTEFSLFENYWYWKSALADVFFIWLGIFLKKTKDLKEYILYLVPVYILLISIILYNDFDRPNVGMTVHCSFTQLIPFLLIAISGCVSLIGCCQMIGKCLWLEYIGRASLVIYCSHWFIAQHLGKYLSLIIYPDGDVKALS